MLYSFPLLAPFTLALRNMRTRQWRTLLTVLGIILGVAVVLAVRIANQSTLDSIRQVFSRTAGNAELLVIPRSTDVRAGAGLDEDILSRLETFQGVKAIAPSIRVQTLLARDVDSFEVNVTINGVASGSFLQVYGVDPQKDPEIRVYELSGGRMPQAGRYETVIPAKYAFEQALHIGNDLVIVTVQGIARLKIVGLLTEEGAALLNDSVVAFAPLEVIQELFERQGELDEVALHVEPRLAEDPRALDKLKEDLNDRLAKDGEVIYPAGRGQLVSQMLATYQQGLAFFSVIAIFVGAFLVYNTFSMTVVERTREIGMLRAIGLSRFQVIGMVLAEAGLLSIVGSAAGLAAGVLLARGLMTLLGAVVTVEENVVTIPMEGVMQGLIVGIGVTLGASLIPAFRAARISPLEALRARGRSGEKISPLVWVGGLGLILAGWAAIYYVPWRDEVLITAGTVGVIAILLGATLTVPLVIEALERFARPLVFLFYRNEGALGSANIRRSVTRTTLTVASLMVALTMVIGIGSMAYSFEQDIISWIDTALGGDLYVRSPVPLRESFAQRLSAVPGVAALTPARYIEVRLSPAYHASLSDTRLVNGQRAERSSITDILLYNAIDPISFRQVGDVEFATGQGDPERNWSRLAQSGAVFISTNVADRYRLRQGDQLVLLTARGERSFEVAAVVMDFSGQGGTVIGTYEDLHRWFSERGVDRFTLRVSPGYDIENVAQEIEARYGNRRNISVQTTESFKGSIRSLMRQSFRLFDVLNLIGVIIGALGVVNTLTMNVTERQREIGGLRSLGMTRGQTLRMILAESLAMGLIGGVYGLAFWYLIARVLIHGLNLINGYELVYLFTPGPFLLGILLAFLVSQLAAVSPARSAAAVNIIDAIKNE